VICRWRYKNTKFNGLLLDLAEEINKGNYKLYNTGQGLNIWNVKSKKDTNVGESWSTNCGVDIAKDSNDVWWFVLYASQISDGYNSQYRTPSKVRGYAGGDDGQDATKAELYTSSHLNLTCDFTIVKV